ncbi:Mediator of RNA polymerase II transcription subunit 28 [Papilio machaon]|uniref:Mediator of RNA polymerase II transcription subunit 28 n=1 Tax=Papilio machaon TaxID=76193 RepID=A0A0N1PHI4_PAPMA|nr:Mediator of RNA polymerase II transcription subunit 28 [Papilio machaon]
MYLFLINPLINTLKTNIDSCRDASNIFCTNGPLPVKYHEHAESTYNLMSVVPEACLNVLTKQEVSPCVEKEEVKVEVERFIDHARQMEAFFLQKRFLLSAMKPELLVKEDNNELKCELQRKDELLRRHYDKVTQWHGLLADLQGHTVYNKCQQQSAPPALQQAASPMPQPCAVQQSVQWILNSFLISFRFLLSAMKPELLVKEDNNELKCELQRKDELLRRHYDKVTQWHGLLADLQGHTVYNKCQQQSAPPALQQAASPMPQPCAVQQSVQAQQMAAAQQAALQQQALQQQQVPRPPHPPAYPAGPQRR